MYVFVQLLKQNLGLLNLQVGPLFCCLSHKSWKEWLQPEMSWKKLQMRPLFDTISVFTFTISSPVQLIFLVSKRQIHLQPLRSDSTYCWRMFTSKSTLEYSWLFSDLHFGLNHSERCCILLMYIERDCFGNSSSFTIFVHIDLNSWVWQCRPDVLSLWFSPVVSWSVHYPDPLHVFPLCPGERADPPALREPPTLTNSPASLSGLHDNGLVFICRPQMLSPKFCWLQRFLNWGHKADWSRSQQRLGLRHEHVPDSSPVH